MCPHGWGTLRRPGHIQPETFRPGDGLRASAARSSTEATFAYTATCLFDPQVAMTEDTVEMSMALFLRNFLRRTSLSGKPPPTDQRLLQDILELTARNELGEAHRRLDEHLKA